MKRAEETVRRRKSKKGREEIVQKIDRQELQNTERRFYKVNEKG